MLASGPVHTSILISSRIVLTSPPCALIHSPSWGPIWVESALRGKLTQTSGKTVDGTTKKGTSCWPIDVSDVYPPLYSTLRRALSSSQALMGLVVGLLKPSSLGRPVCYHAGSNILVRQKWIKESQGAEMDFRSRSKISICGCRKHSI